MRVKAAFRVGEDLLRPWRKISSDRAPNFVTACSRCHHRRGQRRAAEIDDQQQHDVECALVGRNLRLLDGLLI
jgi:cytochrome c553